MRSIQIIKTIALFEMKTLWRSWFFRIMAGLFVIGLGIFNVAVFVESGAPWFYKALPAAIPYANLIMLNIGQAIAAIFLSSEFLKQDRKNDTVEVIYARSMTNGQYIFGKVIGVLTLFILLNFVILILGIGFSFLNAESAKGIGELFLYPIIISLPTLVFIIGLSFFLMTVLKNQAITFIILLGYIALTIFYLNETYYQLFDYIGYQIPMMTSTIAGFVDFYEIVLHRGMYFLLGVGLIFFTVFKMQRLTQSNKLKYLSLFIAIMLILSGLSTAYLYIEVKTVKIDQKKQMIALNNKYAGYPRVNVAKCDAELDHLDDEINVKANLMFANKSGQDIDTLIFSLNPSLHIKSIQLNGQEVEYARELHLVKLKSPKRIKPQEEQHITFYYQGSINENTHLLDADFDNYKYFYRMEICKVKKKFSYLQKDFVCLTSESLWYPVSGVTYATDKPAYYQPDFTLFNLKVNTSENLTAVSQGEVHNQGNGNFEFKNSHALTKISLLIADYEKQAIMVDSVEYAIYTTKGNDYYSRHFTDINDTIPALIRELRNEYETFLDLEYGFKRFAFVEVPLQFSLDKHIWSVTSDAVQPELILYPEKAVIMDKNNFSNTIKSAEEQMKEDNEEVSPKELQCRLFKSFMRGNLMGSPTEGYSFDDVVDRYTYSIIPQYFSFVTHLESEKWSILNLALEIYLRERNISNISSYRWFFRGISKGEKINLELKQSNLEDLIRNGVEKGKEDEEDGDPLIINDVILAKGDYLFSLFRARYGEKEFNRLLNSLIKRNKHKSIPFHDFENEIYNQFSSSISSEVNTWYTQQDLPGFLIKDMQTYKVLDGEYTKYQIRFKIANPEEIDGIITMNIDLDDESDNRRRFNTGETKLPDYSKNIYIPSNSAKEVGVVFSSEPARMNVFTNISENLPNNLIFEFSEFDELKKVPVLNEINDYPLFTELNNQNEIIVDNEDDEFEIIQAGNESYLKALINKNKEDRYKYSGIHFWNPPSIWKPVLRSGFYGRYVRSGMYTRSGEGERKAVWTANLPEVGFYDIYCNIVKIDIEWNRDKRKPNYNFRIYHDDGMEEITLSDEELEVGWNYMGSFYITPENAKVELTNKSVGKMVFADAIKWVKND